jgi:hypothetical protein
MVRRNGFIPARDCAMRRSAAIYVTARRPSLCNLQDDLVNEWQGAIYSRVTSNAGRLFDQPSAQ